MVLWRRSRWVEWTDGQAQFTTSSLGAGTHAITASYNGDTNFSGSTSAALDPDGQPGSRSTTTAVVSSVNPSVYGQAVTFTATVAAVSPGAGTRPEP